MTGADRIATAGAVIGVAAVAVVAFEHACALMRAHGRPGETVRLIPLTVDGLIYAGSMVVFDPVRRKVPVRTERSANIDRREL
jgi:hypothetical protein